MNSLKCSTCVYFSRIQTPTSPITGECRRHPPSREKPGIRNWVFPQVNERKWCGEHQDFKLEASEIILPRIRKIREDD